VRGHREMASSLDGAGDDRHAITALSRGLAVLRAFGEASAPLSNQDLVSATGLPKSTVSRITRTLIIDGFLEPLPRSGGYRLAPAVLRLSRSFYNSTGLAEVAGAHMQELATAIRATVAVAGRDRLDMVYVALARGVSRVHVPQEPGYRVPISRTATGLAYLHAIPAEARRTLIGALRRQNPPDWSAIESDIARTADEIKRSGFCVCPGTWRADVNGVGVPLVLPDQTVVAFNVGGPPFWLKADKMYEVIGPRLVDMVRNVYAEFVRRGHGAR
jgi:DNA-binding IclR family transcriptional regulator